MLISRIQSCVSDKMPSDVTYWAISPILWAPFVPLWAGETTIQAENAYLWAANFEDVILMTLVNQRDS